MTIVNIRGTHGTGKSEIVRRILKRYDARADSEDSKGRPVDYVMDFPDGRELYVVGSYVTACGGCDGIQPYADIWPRVEKFAQRGHVLFEGALVSSSYGNIGRASEKYGDDFIFAFLDTPMDVCIERITKRRHERGNFKPLDPKNTQKKFDSIWGGLPKIRDEFKRRVVVINYKKPIPQVLGLFLGGSNDDSD